VKAKRIAKGGNIQHMSYQTLFGLASGLRYAIDALLLELSNIRFSNDDLRAG
jgi:hypothetical protein